MPLVEGTAENTWVPPEGQHQGLHGPPTSPTLEQLGVWTTGSCLGLRPSSSHLGRRWERGLSPPINKCSPHPRDQDSGSGGTWRDHFSSLSVTLPRGRKSFSPSTGGEASVGCAKEFHPLYPKRPEAAPGSWAGGGGPAPYSGRSWGSFLLVGPPTSEF